MANDARDRAVKLLGDVLKDVLDFARAASIGAGVPPDVDTIAEAIVDDIIAATKAPSEHAQSVGRLIKEKRNSPDKRTYGD